jgi:hypothetical protein
MFKVTNSDQFEVVEAATLVAMSENLVIVSVELDGEDGLIVTFSDGTEGAYVVEELVALRPIRERSKDQPDQGVSTLQSTVRWGTASLPATTLAELVPAIELP